MTQTAAQKLEEYLRTIHAGNVRAGWWNDLKTGESILLTRNRPEIMMLVVTEIVEAADGYSNNLADDKLPQYRMVDVELADTAIRLFDLMGAEQIEVGFNLFWVGVLDDADDRHGASMLGLLFDIVVHLGHATEAYRKGKQAEYRHALTCALASTFVAARLTHTPIFEIIDAKLAFNATREDHKPENRRKAGGKAI